MTDCCLDGRGVGGDSSLRVDGKQKEAHPGAKERQEHREKRKPLDGKQEGLLSDYFTRNRLSPLDLILSLLPSRIAPAVLVEFTTGCSYHHQLSLTSSPTSWEGLDLPFQQTSGVGITWEPVRNADSQAPCQTS